MNSGPGANQVGIIARIDTGKIKPQVMFGEIGVENKTLR